VKATQKMLFVVSAVWLFAAPCLAQESPKTAEEKVPIGLEITQRIAQIVAASVSAITLIIVLFQFKILRRQFELAQSQFQTAQNQFNLAQKQFDLMHRNIRAAAEGQIYARLDALNKLILDNAGVFIQLQTKEFVPDDPDKEKTQLRTMCDMAFTLYEQIYNNRLNHDLLKMEDWDVWQKSMEEFFSKRKFARSYWKSVSDRYSPGFRSWINPIVKKIEELHSQQNAERG
jgi:hypothetical protein